MASKNAGGVTLYPAGQNGFAGAAPAAAAAAAAKKPVVPTKVTHQPIEADIEEEDYASDASAQYESEPEDTGSAPIASHVSEGAPNKEEVRKALDLPHVEKNAQTQVIKIAVDVSPEELMSGKTTITISPKVAQKFMKKVVDQSTGNEVLIGDPSRSQVTKIKVLSYTNELPIDIAIDMPQLKENSAPKITSGSNGHSASMILDKESKVDYTLVPGCEGVLVHENNNALPEELFDQWGGVTAADLTVGITPIAGTSESTLDIDVNRRLPDLLHQNFEQLQRDFPEFRYKDLVKDVKKGRRKIRIWNSVIQKAVEIGVQLALKPISERTIDIAKLGVAMRSTTSENGGFSDVQSLLTRRLGADLAAEAVSRVCTVSLTLQVSALVAGTNSVRAEAAAEAEL